MAKRQTSAVLRDEPDPDSNVVRLHGGGQPGVYHSRSANGAPAQAQRVPLSKPRDPMVRDALRAWDELCGLDNAFDRSQRSTAVLYNDPRLMTSRTCVLRVTDANPSNWVFVYFASGLGVYGGQSFVGRRPRDFPAQAVAEASVYSFADAVIDRKPVAHEIEGVVDNGFVKYQRIAFPVLDGSGDLFEMLTISTDMFRVTFD